MERKWIWVVGAVVAFLAAATYWVEARKDAVDHMSPPSPPVTSTTPEMEAPEPGTAAPEANSAPSSSLPQPPKSPIGPGAPAPAPPSSSGYGSSEAAPAYSPPSYQPISPDYNQVPPPPPQTYGDVDNFEPENAAPATEPGSAGDGGYLPAPPAGMPSEDD